LPCEIGSSTSPASVFAEPGLKTAMRQNMIRSPAASF
jgi:hypothetical protein